jgi:hypothetical protein
MIATGEAVAKKRRMPAGKGFDFFVEASAVELESENCHDLFQKGAEVGCKLSVGRPLHRCLPLRAGCQLSSAGRRAPWDAHQPAGMPAQHLTPSTCSRAAAAPRAARPRSHSHPHAAASSCLHQPPAAEAEAPAAAGAPDLGLVLWGRAGV